MAQPRWLTAGGNLGIVPALDYYDFALDAVDASGGTLVYSLVSGVLPPGLQIVETGRIQGIPVSTAGPDQNQTYRFTVRVRNQSDGGLNDRTFDLTITNVAPPVITPKDVNLGIYFDGSQIYLQLIAVEFVKEDNLVWRVKDGILPPGLTLTESGLLFGYLQPNRSTDPNSDPDWDDAPWDHLPWDSPLGTQAINFTFTVEVTDGVNFDESTYQMYVYPKSAFKADSTLITADQTTAQGEALTIDTGARHLPILITTQEDIPVQRADNYFQYKFNALDLDRDTLKYSVPTASEGGFDEQVNGTSIPYINTIPEGDAWISDGIYPKVSNSEIGLELNLYSGNLLTATVGDYITQSISGANARVTANVTNSQSVTLTSVNGVGFFTGKGNLALNGTTITSGAYEPVPSTVDTEQPITIYDYSEQNVMTGDVVQVQRQNPSTLEYNWYRATITSDANVSVYSKGAVTGSSGDYLTQAISSANLEINTVSNTSGNITFSGNAITANVGDFIVQTATGANATVTANVGLEYKVPVEFTSGLFTEGSGNVTINGSAVDSYPYEVNAETEISGTYLNTNEFEYRTIVSTGFLNINGANTSAYPTKLASAGVTIGTLVTQSDIGFDEIRFDQGTLNLPPTLVMNEESGWLTGQLPTQSQNEITYEFTVKVEKRDYPGYTTTFIYNLTILGDINNRVNWLTPTNLGSIRNGEVADITLTAISSKGKTLYYKLASDKGQELPQGLRLTSNGNISGRATFQVMCFDGGITQFDKRTTTYDETNTFTVTASDIGDNVSANRTFTLRVLGVNPKPYENLYVKAFLSQEQRRSLYDILENQSIFDYDILYKVEDPYYGLPKEIKMLLIPGLNPKKLADYASAVERNHYTKNLRFNKIKTAVVTDDSFDVELIASGEVIGTYSDTIGFVPTDFDAGYVPSTTLPNGTRLTEEHVRYEVVYVEVTDMNSTVDGTGPANSIDISDDIENYFDADSSYTTLYPNAFNNMISRIGNQLGYANKGALPKWMTSRQPDDTVLGFTKGVVLAYTKPGYSHQVAYRLERSKFNFNSLDFSVDRYVLDNRLTQHYDYDTETYNTSTETTFDLYPVLPAIFANVGTVNYAVSIPFENIHRRKVEQIRAEGGMDGVTAFRNGDLLVFAQQEFQTALDISDLYNQGWAQVNTTWDDAPWDSDADTPSDASDDAEWDSSEYVTGYNENLLDSTVINKRIGIWKINIDSNNFVTLTFVQAILNNNSLYVKNGFTYGGTNIYYDPVVKTGKTIPNYSIIPQEIKTTSTRFDDGGTKFYNFRDEYGIPGDGDKYIKFTNTGVFK